ncbi:type II toxin-antitoxin system RelE/ParE family toxin [Nostoc cf. edaphicum LEGE 07299]|uniref:Type II toxin-antitoxin system RelE/ParE family toxin n=1 Tax=Nostoc cf. edaphicum LEGE 07299 TaxID=2777974 RepID=A0ABR9U0C3_9NOSO|nr:type II toxin-antitoxin system RelE/ParE family toxin [Nostoc edaphicum]MBE9105300.1 type II toxin-antitoxin system RelE/ParE family toxin [Nostoc cf. edaphicum LEGE 07299]
MSNYSFSDAAIRDLDEICEYIARSSPKAASKLFDDIRSKCKLVASFPNMGKAMEGLYQICAVLLWMITLYFTIKEKTELVLLVLPVVIKI